MISRSCRNSIGLPGPARTCAWNCRAAGRIMPAPWYAPTDAGWRPRLTEAWNRSRGEEAEAELAAYSPAGFTRGHFFRGVE